MNDIFGKHHQSFFFSDITNNKELYSALIKNSYYCKKINDLTNIALSSFQIENVPDSLSEKYMKKLLINNGSFAITNKSSVGLISQPYEVLTKNQNDEASQIRLMCNSEFTTTDVLTVQDFVIVQFNDTNQDLKSTIENTALYLTLANQCIFNNIVGKSLQYILQGTSEQRESFEHILDDIFNTLGFIGVDLAKGDSNFLKAQTNELEYIGDKMIEIKKHYNDEFLTTLGISHIDYEKKERLIVDEVKTADSLLDLIRSSYINSINDGLSKANAKFNTNMFAVFTLNEKGENSNVVKKSNSEEVD